MKPVYKLIIAIIVVSGLAYICIGKFRTWINFRAYYLSHPEVVGGPCGPNCEAVYEYPKNQPLDNIDSLPGFKVQNKDRILLTGIVYDLKGSPAKDVILYIYHTDTKGIYPAGDGNTPSSRAHGRLRGWIKTGADGAYYFYTNKPAPYPNNRLRAHIHCIIKEPGINEYSIPDFVFPGDPYLMDEEKTTTQKNNGGLTTLMTVDSIPYPIYKRDIYLGRNVFNYKSSK